MKAGESPLHCFVDLMRPHAYRFLRVSEAHFFGRMIRYCTFAFTLLIDVSLARCHVIIALHPAFHHTHAQSIPVRDDLSCIIIPFIIHPHPTSSMQIIMKTTTSDEFRVHGVCSFQPESDESEAESAHAPTGHRLDRLPANTNYVHK